MIIHTLEKNPFTVIIFMNLIDILIHNRMNIVFNVLLGTHLT